jgi:hypothetical protein
MISIWYAGGVLLWIVIGVFILVVVVFLLLGSNNGTAPGSRFPMGSRAWEAELTMGPLLAAIEQRRRELASTTDPVRRERLERQIKFLAAQVDDLQAIIDAKDTSPGKGYIGFEAPPED